MVNTAYAIEQSAISDVRLGKVMKVWQTCWDALFKFELMVMQASSCLLSCALATLALS